MAQFDIYKVTVTPLQSSDEYGSEIDISDRVGLKDIKKVVRTLDASDYDIGVYQFGDISIKVANYDGKFNDENDNRSLFIAGRDRAKVSVEFLQVDDEVGDETTTIKFKGIIVEEATRVSVINDLVRFKVTSNSSILKNTKVPAGSVANGQLVSDAMFNVLNNTTIKSVLNISEANINPDLDVRIDVGSAYDNDPTKTALDEMLLISNSVLTVDSSDNVIIRSRDEDTTRDILNLYGKFDILGRENIVSLRDYNTGRHRMFTSVRVNDTTEDETGLGIDFGERQKKITLDSITTVSKEVDIAKRLLNEFKVPKQELRVTVPTRLVNQSDLLDRVSINYPFRVEPFGEDDFLPIVGTTPIDSAVEPLPKTFGSVEILPNIGFKILQISDDPRSFTSVLKLRQIGTELGDGVFSETEICVVGFAKIGNCIISGTGDPCDTFNPATTGGATISCTKIA